MKLNSLKIKINSKTTRTVEFKDGLNLVTNKRGVGRSGNSVGKSTLSRVVDYLFLGSIDAIYIDDEFKKPNDKIEYLFTNSDVEAQLEFEGLDKKTHIISRNFSIASSKQTFCFDGVMINKDEYEKKLQEVCFDVVTRRPSVRAIVPKFIRNDSHRMLNTTKFLDRHTSSKDYSELFLYLFGFQNTELLTEKRDATNLLKRRERNSTTINSMVREQKPNSEVAKCNAELGELEKDFLKFDYSPKYKDPVSYLSSLQDKEDVLTDAALNMERKIQNIERTVRLLSQQGNNYLLNEVKAIYEFAGVSVDGAIEKLEDVLAFHDNLVAKKKQFLTLDLPELESQRLANMVDLRSLQKSKSDVFVDMRSVGSINNITEKLKKLGELKITLGKLQGLMEQQQLATEDLLSAKKILADVLARISKEIDLVNLFESEFNKHFKQITEKTHAEPYEFNLNFNNETGACDIDVKNQVSNPEGGKKKAEVIAFDFAYIHAVESAKIDRPRFVFHDSIEDVDQKQIEMIFTLAKNLPGQQIVSMLSDKLSVEMYEKYLSDTVLLLSEDDMFFGV